MNNFIKDDFFSKGHFLLKVWQIFITLVMWLPVLLPIVITANSTVFRKVKDHFYRWHYQGGFRLYHHLTTELALFLVAVFILTILLAIRNNYRNKNLYQKKIMYDQEQLKKRTEFLEEFYDERFGEPAYRENVKYYSVAPEKNMPDDFVRKGFKKLEE